MFDTLKQQVCQANLDVATYGLAKLTWGNVSGLSDDRDYLVIKPSGVPYAQMKPDQMAVVSMQTGELVEGDYLPSSDTPTHRLLYRQFDGIAGITHTHSPRATAFAQAQREIPCFGTTHADHFYGPVPVTRPLSADEVQQAYEENTGRVILERFADLDPKAVPGVLVASHAPFAWGASAADSVNNAVALEAVAAMALDALALAPDLQPVEQTLLDKHFFRKHGDQAYYGQPPA